MDFSLDQRQPIQEEIISELIHKVAKIIDIPVEDKDGIKIGMNISDYDGITQLIEENRYQDAILHSLLRMNEIKNDYGGDFLKVQEIVSLANLVVKSLYEYYILNGGFKNTVADPKGLDTPFVEFIKPAHNLIELTLNLDPNEISNQYLLANLLFEYFKLKQVAIEDVENGYLKIIQTTESAHWSLNNDENFLTYSSYLQLGKVFTYASLQNSNYYEKAFTYYNKAYRYATKNNIDTEKLFETIEMLTGLINGKFPLYAMIYSSSGAPIYQYMFEEVRFAPIPSSVGFNLSSLFAARESALEEIFNIVTKQSILEGEDFVIVQNTMAQSDIDQEAIYLILVFANINTMRSLRELANFYEPLIHQIKDKLLEISEVKDYITNFNGFHDETISKQIDMVIKMEFS